MRFNAIGKHNFDWILANEAVAASDSQVSERELQNVLQQYNRRREESVVRFPSKCTKFCENAEKENAIYK